MDGTWDWRKTCGKIPEMLHVWYLHSYTWVVFRANLGKYSRTCGRYWWFDSTFSQEETVIFYLRMILPGMGWKGNMLVE